MTGSPASDPLTYPGEEPPGDVLLYGLRMRQITGGSGSHRTEGLTGWRGVGRGDESDKSLDALLAGLGATPLAGRTPVLAVGSNRCPGQLAVKLSDPARPELGVLPLTRATITGMAAGLSAHISRWGYIPWTPVRRAGGHPHWLTWLDAAQLEVVNATEPNYVLVKPQAFPILLSSDWTADVGPWLMYRSKWGAAVIPPDAHGPSPVMPQQEIYNRLLRLPWFCDLLSFAETPAEAVAKLAADEQLREAVRTALHTYGCAADDRLGDGDDFHQVRLPDSAP